MIKLKQLFESSARDRLSKLKSTKPSRKSDYHSTEQHIRDILEPYGTKLDGTLQEAGEEVFKNLPKTSEDQESEEGRVHYMHSTGIYENLPVALEGTGFVTIYQDVYGISLPLWENLGDVIRQDYNQKQVERVLRQVGSDEGEFFKEVFIRVLALYASVFKAELLGVKV